MLWEVEIHPAPDQTDREAARVLAEARAFGARTVREAQTARSFLIQGDLNELAVRRIADELLVDTVVERYEVRVLGGAKVEDRGSRIVDRDSGLSTLNSQLSTLNILYKPGVTNNVADSAKQAMRQLGYDVEAVATGRSYAFNADADPAELDRLARKALANEAVEQLVWGPLPMDSISLGSDYHFQLVSIPIRGMDNAQLTDLSRAGQLYLTLAEMQTIRQHFAELDRDPTDAELETLAQTWSEHCSHKTLRGRIRYREWADDAGVPVAEALRSHSSSVAETVASKTPPQAPAKVDDRESDSQLSTLNAQPSREIQFDNLLKETIFAATAEIRERLGNDDWCVSVFRDNAGIVKFDQAQNVCMKVETHNHPSALEPYGGANTGLGGVIRDPMGTGLGARPVCNTDVFCFAPPDTPDDALPPGVLHPRVVMKGVVAGVRDYGNRMGIPTVNGAVFFDERYLGNPLVYCGNVAMIPADKCEKHVRPGDLIVAVGGRTGRDGIHGATFSSAELTEQSETVSGGAVQIGNAITEKMVMDVLLQARDRGLYSAITDCGAGGFSSAVGEMGEETGAEVWLDRAPLKYSGLSYTEIWISEAQERMVLAVHPEQWDEFQQLCASEGVEATAIGQFTETHRLVLKYHDHQVADLSMDFLHNGRPPIVREAVYRPEVRSQKSEVRGQNPSTQAGSSPRTTDHGPRTPLTTHYSPLTKSRYDDDLLAILGSFNVCSKEWIIRQYDHEVQAGSVVKPLVGVQNDGPSDAAVVRPDLRSSRGLVIACGMNPHYGDLDPYWMAASAIDEAVRNCVAVGADPRRIALLDNFCWGNTDRPETLGTLVRAALGCHDIALAYGCPFISGKDSLNNEFTYRAEGQKPEVRSQKSEAGEQHSDIPHSALRTPHSVTVAIPPSLLISALGQIDDIARAVTMDLKEPGNRLYLVGATKPELGGSHFVLVNPPPSNHGSRTTDDGQVPQVDPALAPRLFAAVHESIRRGMVRSCHDLSEGGLAVAAAEMSFAGGLGVELDLKPLAQSSGITEDAVLLFSESNTRFLLEVPDQHTRAFEKLFHDLPAILLGVVSNVPRIQVFGRDGKQILDTACDEAKAAWQRPLAWE